MACSNGSFRLHSPAFVDGALIPCLPGAPPQQANGARHGHCWGVTRFQRLGYQGPLPPQGPLHRYGFRLHAIDQELPLPPGCTVADLQEAMVGHLLATAELTGLYARSPTNSAQSAAECSHLR